MSGEKHPDIARTERAAPSEKQSLETPPPWKAKLHFGVCLERPTAPIDMIDILEPMTQSILSAVRYYFPASLYCNLSVENGSDPFAASDEKDSFFRLRRDLETQARKSGFILRCNGYHGQKHKNRNFVCQHLFINRKQRSTKEATKRSCCCKFKLCVHWDASNGCYYFKCGTGNAFHTHHPRLDPSALQETTDRKRRRTKKTKQNQAQVLPETGGDAESDISSCDISVASATDSDDNAAPEAVQQELVRPGEFLAPLVAAYVKSLPATVHPSQLADVQALLKRKTAENNRNNHPPVCVRKRARNKLPVMSSTNK